MEKVLCSGIDEQGPAFYELKKALTVQLDRMEVNTCEIYDKLNIIHPQASEVDQSEKTSTCDVPSILAGLWECVDRIKKYNSWLERNIQILASFVG